MDIFKHNNFGEVAAALAHNYRAELTTNTINEVDNDYYAFADDFKGLTNRAFSIIEEREEAFKERMGRSLNKNTAKAVEIVLEINEDTTAQDIMDSYGEYFKSEFGAEILGIAVHKDEGYIVSKEPPHRPLTSGVEFELDQESGKYYHLKSNGATYERGAELDISKYSFIDNLHAQLIISNLREDGSSITGTSKLYPHFKKMDKEWMKYFANSWREIYNQRLPHKQPLIGKDKNSDKPINSVSEPMLQLIAEKIIQGTRNKEKLTETLEKYIEDNKNPIQRIKGYKHFLGRLNKVAYGESLNKRDYGTFLSQMKASGCAGRLSQIIIDKISQMSDQELKECDTSTFGRFRGMILNMIKGVEVENPNFDPKDAKIKALKTENTELKAELDTAKAEIKGQINEKLDKNSQKHTALKEVSLSSDELDIYAKNKEIVAQAKDALTSFKTAEMISALKALRKQNMELEDILKKRALRDYADLKARSGSKIAEEPKTTQTLTKTEKRAENCPKSSDFFENISILKPKN
ncbi:MAG: plasmid recombination protein [Campylobacter sp.]|uniref:hypothetical protein n=1 Tax=Campylobacter sp. TaxID=205 RepID=UPI002AA66DBB|nr:hypothetical protein [Campylobacter sp.]MCI7023157.1 plasmid recombination protein [Campylobacter sp.]